MEDEVSVTFDDAAGVDEAKEELVEVIEFLKSPEKFTRLRGKLPKGILLGGPAGTGKTLLACAVAGQSGVPFFSMSGSEFVESNYDRQRRWLDIMPQDGALFNSDYSFSWGT